MRTTTTNRQDPRSTKTTSTMAAGECQQHAEDVDIGGQLMPHVDDDDDETDSQGRR